MPWTLLHLGMETVNSSCSDLHQSDGFSAAAYDLASLFQVRSPNTHPSGCFSGSWVTPVRTFGEHFGFKGFPSSCQAGQSERVPIHLAGSVYRSNKGDGRTGCKGCSVCAGVVKRWPHPAEQGDKTHWNLENKFAFRKGKQKAQTDLGKESLFCYSLAAGPSRALDLKFGVSVSLPAKWR